MKRALVLAIALSLAPAIAWAEQGDCDEGDRDCTVYEFGDEEIDGSRDGAGLDLTTSNRHRAYERLINIRSHFLPELFKSVEQL